MKKGSIGFYLWSYKIITLFIGYLIAKLGYNLLIKGITGEFQFSAELKGGKADLASASPGVFFILMAAVIISIGLYKGLELYSVTTEPTGEKLILSRPPINPFEQGEK